MAASKVLGRRAEELVRDRIGEVEARNARFFDEEVQKLDRWADDLKFGLEREIKDLDKKIKEVRREARAAITLTDKLAAQKRIRNIEVQRNRRRRELYEAQDGIDRQRDELIEKIERQLEQTHETTHLYTVRWTIT